MKPRKQVAIKWNSNFAYALGLITTDGNLYNDGYHFDFTSKDKYLIQLFAKCLGLKNKIGRKTSGYTGRTDAFRIQFGDVNFYKWCLEFGLKPNKSKRLKGLKVPDKFFFDFLRGCFDGDGSMYAYWDPRWHSSYMFYLQFASASSPFLIWLRNTIKRLAKIDGKINNMKKARQLRYAKNGTIAVFNKMFYDKNVSCLRRKFIKAQKIFEINKKHNNSSAQVMKLVNMLA